MTACPPSRSREARIDDMAIQLLPFGIDTNLAKILTHVNKKDIAVSCRNKEILKSDRPMNTILRRALLRLI